MSTVTSDYKFPAPGQRTLASAGPGVSLANRGEQMEMEDKGARPSTPKKKLKTLFHSFRYVNKF